MSNKTDETREGWASASLGDLLDMHYGKALPESTRKRGPVPVYGSNGVVGWHNAAITNGPAIIVGRKGSAGAVHLCLSPCWPIDTTYFIDEFGPYDPKLLHYLLRE